MKELMNRAIDFLTFDAHLPSQQISLQFSETHHKRQAEIDEWSTVATRQQLISSYWSSLVTCHFAVFFGGSAGISFLILGGFYQPDLFLATMFIVCPIVYLGFYIFQYRPKFNSIYLPRLETAKEAYEKKQIEQIEKCRQAQLSNFSLALFFYVLYKTNNLKAISCDDHSANLLKKLYGVDSGSMKKNLELILGTAKRKNISDRKITELRNRFTETYEYLEALGFSAGIEKLKELEASFFNA
ncbi:MAG: hypothetical protein EPO58_01455 [Chitinophagaceae bacterium]|nr:MAG: hypothetical protein EPO58_01455 [Chitinophagaceae bacterium]